MNVTLISSLFSMCSVFGGLYWGSDFSLALQHVSFESTLGVLDSFSLTDEQRKAALGGNLLNGLKQQIIFMNTTDDWNGQVAIITGGANGLGFTLASRLSKRGVKVALWDVDEEKLCIAASQIGSAARPKKIDVTAPTQVQAEVEALLAEFGRIDILVNCAGITGRTNIQSHEVDLADFDRVMNINLRGSLITFQAVIGPMLSRNYGRVLHVASISGKDGNAGMLAYSTSKAAVIGMTKVQGKEYAGTGIRINALAPAVIRTEMVAALPKEQIQYMTDKIPTGRCAELTEFAALAEFVVSPENSFTTAFTYDLSGGRAVY